MLYRRPLLVGLGAALLAGCWSEPTSQGPIVVQVQVVAPSRSIEEGETVKLVATPLSSRGQVVQTRVRWESAFPEVATVDDTGLVTAVHSGSTEIIARAGGHAGRINLVIRPRQLSVVVTPTVVSVRLGDLQLFDAQVRGLDDQRVVWSVDGVPGGNETVGTISGSGIYSAPFAMPPSAQLMITATSVANPQLTGTSTVTLTPRPL
jgi:hypothetical protein